MVQLDEIYDGEIISLKKGKNGLVTIKIQTKNKKEQKNERIFSGKLGCNPWSNRNNLHSDCNVSEEENTRRTPSGENCESGSESGKEIPSSEGSSLEA